jgi:invasion protein IalB
MRPPAGIAQSGPVAADPLDEQPLIHSPWKKFCFKAPSQPDLSQICVTRMDVRLETGAALATAELIDPGTNKKNTLRITVPCRVQYSSGVHVSLDGRDAMSANYQMCHVSGRFADFEASTEFIQAMKRSKSLLVQVANWKGKTKTITLPLEQFAQANDQVVDPEVLKAEIEAARRRLNPAYRPTICAGAGSDACFWNSKVARPPQ